MVTWSRLCVQRSRDPDIDLDSSFAFNRIIYSVHPTKLLLIPQYYDVRPTYRSTCSWGHGGGWKEKRLLSWRLRAYLKPNNVTRMVMAWGCVQPPKVLGPTQTSGQGAQPAGRSGISSLLVRRQLLTCLLQCSMGEVSGPQWLSA